MNEQPCRRLRVFISQPTKGKTNKEIEKEREELIKFAKEKLGEDIDVNDPLSEMPNPPGASSLWSVTEPIKALSFADACVFADGYEKDRGCVLVHKACEDYGIKVFEYGNPVHNAEDDDTESKKDWPTLDGAQVKAFKPVFNLEGTIEGMMSSDYKQRFVAEYLQTKVRYEKLKNLNNKYLATKESGKDHLGFKPSCSLELLARQQRSMGEYLACLEQRAFIEDIELPNPYVNR